MGGMDFGGTGGFGYWGVMEIVADVLNIDALLFVAPVIALGGIPEHGSHIWHYQLVSKVSTHFEFFDRKVAPPLLMIS